MTSQKGGRGVKRARCGGERRFGVSCLALWQPLQVGYRLGCLGTICDEQLAHDAMRGYALAQADCAIHRGGHKHSIFVARAALIGFDPPSLP